MQPARTMWTTVPCAERAQGTPAVRPRNVLAQQSLPDERISFGEDAADHRVSTSAIRGAASYGGATRTIVRLSADGGDHPGRVERGDDLRPRPRLHGRQIADP